MVTEYNLTDLINDECYNEYYKKPRDWDKYYEDFKRIWQNQGLGFLVREISRKDKCVKVQAYYGSSTYNTKEMSLLIELLIQECKQLEIETKTTAEIKSLLDSWSGTNR